MRAEKAPRCGARARANRLGRQVSQLEPGGKKNNPVSSDITWERSQGLGFRVSEGEIVLYTRVHLVEKILDVSTVAFCLFVVNTV